MIFYLSIVLKFEVQLWRPLRTGLPEHLHGLFRLRSDSRALLDTEAPGSVEGLLPSIPKKVQIIPRSGAWNQFDLRARANAQADILLRRRHAAPILVTEVVSSTCGRSNLGLATMNSSFTQSIHQFPRSSVRARVDGGIQCKLVILELSQKAYYLWTPDPFLCVTETIP